MEYEKLNEKDKVTFNEVDDLLSNSSKKSIKEILKVLILKYL